MSRIQGKKCFLTYQHTEKDSSFTLANLLQFFQLRFPDLHSYSLGLEQYPNEEGTHIHCLLVFAKKETVYLNTLTYCQTVPFNKAFTGHKKKDVLAVHRYCVKNGEYLSNLDEDAYTSKESKWSDILSASTKEEAVAQLCLHYPRDAILSRRNFDYWAEQHFKVIPPPFDPGEKEFTCPEVLQEWKIANIDGKFFLT